MLELLGNSRLYYNDMEELDLKTRNNGNLAHFVERYELETNPEKYFNNRAAKRRLKRAREKHEFVTDKAMRIARCGKSQFYDVYPTQRVKILNSVNLCRNKYCLNCQNQKQNTHIKEYAPIIDEVAQNHDIYHMTLTLPNVSGILLEETRTKMMKSFTKLANMILLSKKFRKEFEYLGCVAVLRAEEITFKGNDYHPHIHAMIALHQDLGIQKNEIHDKFSYDFKNGQRTFKRFFSKLELQLQKVWWLLLNGQRVNKKTLATAGSYSLILDKVEDGRYYEVFKYLVKPHEDGAKMSYYQYKTLRKALDRKRTLQGYGLFYGVEERDINEEDHEARLNVEAQLQLVEKPVKDVHMTLNDLKEQMLELDEAKAWTYITFRKIHNLGCEVLDKIASMHKIEDKTLDEKRHEIIDARARANLEKIKYKYEERVRNLRGRYPSNKEVQEYMFNFHTDKWGRAVRAPFVRNPKQVTLLGGEIELVKKPTLPSKSVTVALAEIRNKATAKTTYQRRKDLIFDMNVTKVEIGLDYAKWNARFKKNSAEVRFWQECQDELTKYDIGGVA